MWQQALKNLISNAEDLLRHLELDPTRLPVAIEANFPLRVPMPFVERMQKNNPQDPLLLQVLCQKLESIITDGYVTDPLQEKQYSPVPGVIKKFQRRVLLTLTGSCAIHCRYCFRRHFPYQEHQVTGKYWRPVYNYLSQNEDINEIIFSGGDPLMLTNSQLDKILRDINQLDHVRIVRFHTRLPVVIPSRIDTALIEQLKNINKKIIFVYHINHPQELCSAIKEGAQQLLALGAHVYNQSVLLRHINDNVSTLQALSFGLIEHHIQPYYLHQLDKVQGAAHFYVPPSIGLKLHEQLREHLPGYLVPQYVQEVPGQNCKVPVKHLCDIKVSS